MIISWLLGFIMPIAAFLGMITFLLVLDFITGIRAAKHRGEAITSKGFGRTVEKILLYYASILAARGLDVVFLIPKDYMIDLTWIVAGFIAVTEFKSLLENVYAITGTDIWKEIADILPRFKKKK